ncbi:Gx transporter family protein [Candidatus Fermentibacteria bacterium]|nr:Gx transporter family protein [Candidatus Fermentibacteria bacterium]
MPLESRRGAQAAGGSSGRILFLALAATVTGILESFLPRPMPFIKPGLANVVTVLAVLSGGLYDGLRVNLLRSAAVALATGSLATPSFLLSIAGATASAAAMGFARPLVPGFLSVTGLSVLGSAASMASQLALAAAVIPGLPVAALVPVLAVWAAAAGVLTGILAAVLSRLAGGRFGGSGLVEGFEAG